MNAVASLTSNLAARLRGLCQSQEERGELWTELIFVLITLDTAAASARTRGTVKCSDRKQEDCEGLFRARAEVFKENMSLTDH